jgi:hypothetical protein
LLFPGALTVTNLPTMILFTEDFATGSPPVALQNEIVADCEETTIYWGEDYFAHIYLVIVLDFSQGSKYTSPQRGQVSESVAPNHANARGQRSRTRFHLLQ